MLQWKIYCSNGHNLETFSSDDGEVKDAPGFDVQVIAMIDASHGWGTQSKSDYYVWDDRGSGYRWWGVDLMGLGDYFNKRGQWQKVLKGTTITSETFSKIFAMVQDDESFLEKTGFYRGERRPNETV